MIKNLKNKCPYVVAEIGVNHNGNLEIAKKSILAAAKAGADAVKFQMFNTEEFMSNSGENYKYKMVSVTKLKQLINKNSDRFILIDVRNEFENKINLQQK